MITDDKILNFNSFVVSLFFSALIIYNSKSKNTFLFSKLLIYEGLGIGFISFWIVNLGLFINIFNFIESYNLGIVCILIILILTLLSFYNGSKINIKKLNVYSSKFKKPLKNLSNLTTKKFVFVFLFKNLLPSIGDKVSATKDETRIAKERAIAVSLNKVTEIPFMKIRGKKTAIKIKVVANTNL